MNFIIRQPDPVLPKQSIDATLCTPSSDSELVLMLGYEGAEDRIVRCFTFKYAGPGQYSVTDPDGRRLVPESPTPKVSEDDARSLQSAACRIHSILSNSKYPEEGNLRVSLARITQLAGITKGE